VLHVVCKGGEAVDERIRQDEIGEVAVYLVSHFRGEGEEGHGDVGATVDLGCRRGNGREGKVVDILHVQRLYGWLVRQARGHRHRRGGRRCGNAALARRQGPVTLLWKRVGETAVVDVDVHVMVLES